MLLTLLMTNRVLEIGFSGTYRIYVTFNNGLNLWLNELHQVENKANASNLLHNLWHYLFDDFSKFHCMLFHFIRMHIWSIIHIQQLAKNGEKPCYSTHFYNDFQKKKPGFFQSYPSLFTPQLITIRKMMMMFWKRLATNRTPDGTQQAILYSTNQWLEYNSMLVYTILAAAAAVR